MTAAIVGMDAKVGQQSVNAVPEKALVAFCFDDQLVGKRELWKLAARTEPPPGRRELPVQPVVSSRGCMCFCAVWPRALVVHELDPNFQHGPNAFESCLHNPQT